MYVKRLMAGWGDMDSNAHMRNTSYLDKSGDVRMMYFAANGFPIDEFARLRIGPVVMKDEVEYFREINLLEELDVSLMVAGMAEDGSRFRVRNEFFQLNGKLSARVTSTGGWLDLAARKLVVPPAGLHAAVSALARTADFEILPSSLK